QLSSFQHVETEMETEQNQTGQEEPIVSENPAEEPETIPEPEPMPEPEPEPEPEQPVVYTTVKIPSGSTGVRIAGILKDSGIIDSTTDFINRTESRGLVSKLQSGSFKIGSDMDLDEIIDKLTGQ
ncbi:MAG: hypothetical protein C0604_02360, partial [Clostridiales bacterium]